MKDILKNRGSSSLLLMLLIAISTLSVSAQIEPGIRMGIRVNGGLSSLTDDGNNAAFGFGAHWIAEYNAKLSMYIQSGIGVEDIAYIAGGDRKDVFFLQMPVHGGFRFVKGNKTAYFIQAGPTFGIGLWGTRVLLYGCGSTHYNYGSYFEYTGNRFDLGLGGRVGIESGKFQISAGANYGVLHAVKDWEYGHNLSVNLGVAYMF